MKKIADGWHIIAGYDVYVKDGYIIRGTKEDQNGSILPAFVYREDRTKSGRACNGWYSVDKITPDAFRTGVRRGTIRLF